jgi:hypothetical protein
MQRHIHQIVVVVEPDVLHGLRLGVAGRGIVGSASSVTLLVLLFGPFALVPCP